ncbi:hypothetical protein AVEN_12894-1 [Araneus ventricosus]|uniref:ATP-dependent DNA helicase n=1 Tax=Araneus ventricosus TaxID=182803 RepID=A0A4Y2HKV3_ARAVE|nr:hypothetical protein AVEN_12894-1 [Araneus ventricosus]
MWRLNEFNLSEKSHTVVRLAVHLPDQQAIVHQDGQEEEAVARAATRQTTLTAWFELNKNDQDSHNYLHTDIPHYYTFNKSVIKWQKWQQGGEQVIGRMPVVNIQDSERYYLRLLLLRKLGAVSFEDLKTVDEIVCNTFQQTFNDIPELWFRYKDALSEDFVQQYSEDSGPQYALAEIEEFFKHYNLNLKKLKLPTVHLPDALSNLPSFDILVEQQKGQINAQKLNEEQKLVFDILKAIYDNKEDTSRLFFLDGPAGTGKTFLYNTLLHTIRGKGHHVTPVASTGIAATLLNGGRAAHSVFKIPIVLNATSTCNVKTNTQEAKLICDTKLIIWNEAPMTHVHAFIAVDTLLQDLANCSLPFGGNVILLGGNFRQVLPVVSKGSRSLTVDSCLKKHNLWSKFIKLNLIKNMRALETERKFSNWLLEIGEGKSGDNVLACLPGEIVVYEAVDDIISDDPNDRLTFPVEFLNSLTPTGMPPYKLNLKPGCIIMLLRNLAPTKGLCNGTHLIVTELQRNIIEAKRIGSANGKTDFIPQIPLNPSDSNMPFKFKRKQFPVRLAYSMTINKAQRQTFEKICLMLNNPVFSHGQLYVGFSCVKSFDSVTVVAPSRKIVNCVYQEVLID